MGAFLAELTVKAAEHEAIVEDQAVRGDLAV